jgi:murein DD-endopeptidase MepM/ murein hydrolase activator NlpD
MIGSLGSLIVNHLSYIGLGFLLLLGLTSCQSPNQSLPTPVETLENPAAGFSTDMAGSQPVSTVADPVLPTPTQANPAPVYFTPTPHFTPTPGMVTTFSICSPLEDHSLTDLLDIISFPYDPPPPGKDTGHHGVDFAYYRRGERLSIQGVPVQSVLPGRVAAINHNLIPYGNMIMVETPYNRLSLSLIDFLGIPDQQSIYLLYAHMQDPPLPAFGEEIACGQTLGAVGNTPEHWSSAPHLHFEARYGPAGYDFSGMRFYDPYAQIEEMEMYILWRTSGDFVLLDPLVLLEHGLSTALHEGD